MPIYVYRNLVTGETFEIEQRMTEDALTEHPETGEPVKRLIQPVGIAFKGSGFYVNDARAGGRKSDKGDKGATGGAGAPEKAAAGASESAGASSTSTSTSTSTVTTAAD